APQPAPPQTTQRAPEVQPVGGNPDDAALGGRADLERARGESRDLDEQLRHAREQLYSLRSELAGSKSAETRLTDQLRENELRVAGMTAELTRLQAARLEDTELIADQKLRLRNLTDQLNASS